MANLGDKHNVIVPYRLLARCGVTFVRTPLAEAPHCFSERTGSARLYSASLDRLAADGSRFPAMNGQSLARRKAVIDRGADCH